MNGFSGKVFLVGAGPGDPGLITRRGADVLASASTVVVDALVNPALLREAPNAKIIYVGKRGPGAPDGAFLKIPQAGINKLLVRLARRGERVVRLKGGDPFVFGRGSEELEFLHKNKIPYEVVPGVSSAFAAPAFAGIPVTDRRWASHVTIITAHKGEDENARTPAVDVENFPKTGTLVILMGVSRWSAMQKKLLAAGWPPSVPVAAVESATTARQRALTSTLKNSARDFGRKKLVAPAVIVVGAVGRLAKTLHWAAEQKPLLGRRVVVTRTVEQNSPLASLLSDSGAEVIAAPSIEVKPIKNLTVIQSLREQVEERRLDWIVFLSANGVKIFADLVRPAARFMRKIKICSVGPKTSHFIRRQGWTVAREAPGTDARSVVSTLGKVRNKRILFPRVLDGPQDAVHTLRHKGALIFEAPLYETLPVKITTPVRDAILQGVDAVTFLSAATARHFTGQFSPLQRKRIQMTTLAVAIGPTTHLELKSLGWKKIRQARVPSIEGVAEILRRVLGRVS